MLGRFFRGGKVRPGFFFPRGKIYTGILFPGAILSRGGFSGGKFYAGGNSMLQHRSFIFINWIHPQEMVFILYRRPFTNFTQCFISRNIFMYSCSDLKVMST